MLLPSLRIENYRVFDRFEIERLGRVNLFVGRNNSGKSSLLEAVRIFASRGAPSVLWDILVEREELANDEPTLEQVSTAVDQLFRGRELPRPYKRPAIVIGYPDNLLRIDDDPESRPREMWGIPGTPVLRVFFREKSVKYPLEELDRWRRRARAELANGYEYVPAGGLDSTRAAKLWDAIALTAAEDEVTAALRFVSPDIERISIVGMRTTVMAKIAGFSKPVPLRSLGDGVNRVLGIALALVNASNGGVLVIDEIENGLHHSVQRQVWELIFATAHRLNVQVFATTHSWDCIEAFQHAAAADRHEEALLVRLEDRKGHIKPTVVREHELTILAREQIEVR